MRYVDSFFRISIIPPFYFTISKHCLPSSFSYCIVLSYFIKHNWSPPNYTDICFYQVVASAFGSVVVSRAVTSIQLRSPSFFSTMAHLLTNRSRIRHHSPSRPSLLPLRRSETFRGRRFRDISSLSFSALGSALCSYSPIISMRSMCRLGGRHLELRRCLVLMR